MVRREHDNEEGLVPHRRLEEAPLVGLEGPYNINLKHAIRCSI